MNGLRPRSLECAIVLSRDPAVRYCYSVVRERTVDWASVQECPLEGHRCSVNAEPSPPRYRPGLPSSGRALNQLARVCKTLVGRLVGTELDRELENAQTALLAG